jgi:dienelactone hydrolase
MMVWKILTAVLTAALVALLLTVASPMQAQAQQVESGAFLVRLNGDTVAIDRFRRTDARLEGTLSIKGQPRFDYSAELGAGNTVTSITLNVFAASATIDDAPLQVAKIVFKGDSVIVDAAGRTQKFATKAGALPGLPNAIAMTELFTRRARAAGGTVEIPYFALGGAMTLPYTLTPVGADSIVAAISGQEMRLRVDAVGRILGGAVAGQKVDILRVSAAAAAPLKLGKPDYSAPADAPYTAEEVTITGPKGITLGGTLTIPKNANGPVPAIVTITGSGQQDRDEFIPVAGGYRPFRQVADTLGRRGIAVLRMDDRTVGMSGGAIGTSADYADDIRAALAYLRTRKDIDANRLGLVGHSEGGLIGPMVAATDSRLKTLVVMAGPAYTGAEIIKFQQKYGVEHAGKIAPAQRDSALKASQAALDSMAKTDVWFKYFLTYDPIPTAKRVKTSTIILQGANDQQVTQEQATKLGNAMRGGGNKDVTVNIFTGLNHLFIADSTGNPAGYTQLKSNKVSTEVLGTMADWLVVRFAAKPVP